MSKKNMERPQVADMFGKDSKAWFYADHFLTIKFVKENRL